MFGYPAPYPVIINDTNDAIDPRATTLFEQAIWKGRKHRIWARLTGKGRCLRRLQGKALDAAYVKGHETGIQAVPLTQITGSVNRASDFDDEFLPTNDRAMNRWRRVASLMLHGDVLPPVELIKVGDAYFVMDGHNRVSVARMLDRDSIDAVIFSAN